jgi:hypothetical protein
MTRLHSWIEDDVPQARRWLASVYDGVDALTDDQVREGARLRADAQDAQHVAGNIPLREVTPALEQQRRCDARWADFRRRHGLMGKPPPRGPKGRPLRSATARTGRDGIGPREPWED